MQKVFMRPDTAKEMLFVDSQDESVKVRVSRLNSGEWRVSVAADLELTEVEVENVVKQ